MRLANWVMQLFGVQVSIFVARAMECQKMPEITISMAAGRTDEQKAVHDARHHARRW